MSYINNRCKKLNLKVIKRYLNVKNLFTHKRLVITFSLKKFFSFIKSLKILISRYICDNYYFYNYRPTEKWLDTFQYPYHKPSNKHIKKS